MLLLSFLFTFVLHAFELEVTSDAVMHDLKTGEKREIKGGASAKVNEANPIWVSSAGRVPVLIVPLSAQGSQVKVESPRADQVLKEEKDLKIDSSLSEVMLYLTDIHRLIAQRDFVLAGQKTGELRAKFPEVKFINFIEASVAFLSGDRNRARILVTAGLEAHPNYAPGLELLKKLEGSQ